MAPAVKAKAGLALPLRALAALDKPKARAVEREVEEELGTLSARTTFACRFGGSDTALTFAGRRIAANIAKLPELFG
jgi:hypothetical protein